MNDCHLQNAPGEERRTQIPQKVSRIALGAAALLAFLPTLNADDAAVEQLRREIAEMKQQFEQTQQDQRRQIEALTRKLEEVTGTSASKPGVDQQQLEAELASELGQKSGSTPSGKSGTSARDSAAPASQPMPWSPSDALRLQSGQAYLDLSLVGTFAAGTSTADDIAGGTQLGGHDPNQRGFSIQGLELNLRGAVDPYFRGNASVLYLLDSEGESHVELEEGWLETTTLPAGFQLRAGQLLTDFGRQNPTHPHTWAFVDTPLVLGRFFGPDGLRNPGARVSWLTPTPFYSQVHLTLQNSQGATASSFRNSGAHAHGAAEEVVPFAYRHADNDRGVDGFEDLLLTPRYEISFDLTPNQVLLAGVSAAFGPNSRGAEDASSTLTQIYGVDLTWKWRPARHHGGFPFVAWQTEALLRRYEAGQFDWDENGNGIGDEGEILDTDTGAPALLRHETLVDYGLYTQLLYGFKKGWVAGLRFDMAGSDEADYERRSLSFGDEELGRDPQRAFRWRLSPNLTWYPTEYSKLRLQYNYDDRQGIGSDHSVWLQFEFLLGAHAAHKF